MKHEILTCLLLFIGFLILFHQAVQDGKWFEPRQFLHHENLAAVLFAFAGGILFTLKTKR